MSSVTSDTPQSSGGGETRLVLLYVGIGVVGLLALLGLFIFFRRQHRLAMRPTFYPANPQPAGWNTPPVNVAPPVVLELRAGVRTRSAVKKPLLIRNSARIAGHD